MTLLAFATLMPFTQKVAFTPHCCSRSKMRGVLTGSGPSSKVSATSLDPVEMVVPNAPEPDTCERSKVADSVHFRAPAGGLEVDGGFGDFTTWLGDGETLGDAMTTGSTGSWLGETEG